IIIGSIGSVIEVGKKHIKTNGTVPAGNILVDGSGVGDVGSIVLRDRRHLAQDGMLVAVVGLSAVDGSITSGPDIITRGFVYVKESEELIEELKERVVDSIYDCQWNNVYDWTAIKGAIKGNLSEYLYKKTKRTPMILPVVMET
ncbi:MAG: ribonuclease J, partial [Oscillospiraceae bacterium]|nr:ribonuclease J [Oscillospiraceae bacterium]